MKRYAMTTYQDPIEVYEDAAGEWVRYEDAAALEAEVATLQRKNATLLESCKVRGAAMERAVAEVERLKAERDHWASDAGPDSCVAILKENERLRALLEESGRRIAELEAEVELLRVALDGELLCRHIYAGLCPDTLTGSESRDPECPQCQRLIAVDALATSAPTKPGPDSP